jgi:predicted phosphodiesterase
MPIAVADIGMFLTGGNTNTNANLSLGGNVSTTEVLSDKTNNLFRRITDSEAGSGITLYRCVAIKNKNTTDTFRNVVFYMVEDTKSVDDLALYSYAQAAKNTIETAIPLETNAPTGSKINFIAALNRSGGLALGDLAPGDFINVWMRISVNPGAQQFTDNSFKVRVEVNGTAAGGGSGGGGTGGGGVPPPDDSGVEFRMSASSDTGTGKNAVGILSKMKARKVEMIIYNGDLAYSSSMSGWLDMTSSVRDKSMISFGNHDTGDGDGSKTTINDLKAAYSISNVYYSKVVRNVGFVVMNASKKESTGASYSSGSAQYNFVKKALSDFKTNSAIEWIVVCNHFPIVGPPNAHHPNEDDVRDLYVPLFEDAGVDFVITGHNHALWRTKLVRYNSSSPGSPTVVSDGPDHAYNRAAAKHGEIYLDVGAGGDSHYDIGSLPSWVPFNNQSKFGYLLMEFSSSGKKITFKFYDSSDNLLDTSSVTHL